MNDDELNKNLWEVIRAWRDMNMKPHQESDTWHKLLNLPEPDFAESHDVYAAIENDRFGLYVVMTDSTNCAVERLKIRLKNEEE